MVNMSCRRLLLHLTFLAADLACVNADKIKLARIAMMAITTNNSTKVNPPGFFLINTLITVFILLRMRNDPLIVVICQG
jgi:hypothetical protein